MCNNFIYSVIHSSFICSNTTPHCLYLVPGEPRRVHVEAHNSTSIKVKWQPPYQKEHNGIIRGYQVHYIEIDRTSQTVGRPQMYDLMDGDKNEVMLAKLKPDTSYQVRVAAYTRKGDGQRSPARMVKTKGAGEGRLSLLKTHVQLI